jgi:hypothetical protein
MTTVEASVGEIAPTSATRTAAAIDHRRHGPDGGAGDQQDADELPPGLHGTSAAETTDIPTRIATACSRHAGMPTAPVATMVTA